MRTSSRKDDTLTILPSAAYLFDGNNAGESKSDVILRRLESLFEQYPDHRLCVTGHSLGGSLAILEAFKLAFVSEIPKPITVITFGPMLVGGLRFRQAFQAFEDEKKIRCLCVVNDGDLIPLFPYRGACSFYRPIGKRLLLFEKKKAVLSSPPRANTALGALVVDAPNVIVHGIRLASTFLFRRRFWECHSVRQTMGNLSAAADQLNKMTMSDVFDDDTDRPPSSD